MLSKNLIVAASNAGAATYIEDVFSTYLYTGNGSTQTITNGIDLAGEDGLVWIKGRSGATDHQVFDTIRGATYELITNSTAAQVADTDTLTAFNSNGFSLGADATTNTSSATYASWTFRKQAKFFDVVTYTGNGSNRTISHNLGSVPGCIIVKRLETADWQVYHRSLANTEYLVLNSTAAKVTGTTRWNSTTPTSTEFSLGTDTTVNASGGTYVAYLFAHDAGGFGVDGTENVISCGSYVGNSSSNGQEINCGFEPQWILVKKSNGVHNWLVWDTMRGIYDGTATDPMLYVNGTNADDYRAWIKITPTGFKWETLDQEVNSSSYTYIYIAIRRGPMKTPEAGTKVYNAQTPTPTGVDNREYTGVGFPLDAIFLTHRTGGGFGTWIEDRLRGPKKPLYAYSTMAEDGAGQGSTQGPASFDQDGWTGGSGDSGQWDYNVGYTNVFHYFRRSPGFFDMVCYTGTGAATQTIPHNLGVTPQLIIVKCRSDASTDWLVKPNQSTADYLYLNFSNAQAGPSTTIWSSTNQDATNFYVGPSAATGAASRTFVAYLFATVAGVSKVGSYTGNGSNQTINCGFSTGARFVLIKRTDDIGDWYVWDSARGIVAGDDPHLSLNSTAAEVTTDDTIDPASSGFIVNQLSATNVNVSSATYIYLAIA